MPADDPAVLPKARRSRRILLWTAIVLVALFGLLALIAQLTVAPEIKSQLIAAVEDHLHATLKIGGIRLSHPIHCPSV